VKFIILLRMDVENEVNICEVVIGEEEE